MGAMATPTDTPAPEQERQYPTFVVTDEDRARWDAAVGMAEGLGLDPVMAAGVLYHGDDAALND